MKNSAASKLQNAIIEAARATFVKLRDAHPKEEFYAFALYTSNEANYITASANTEEGLLQRAKHYEKREKKGIKRHADSLRWNAPDWAYHCVGDEQFEQAQEVLDALPDINDLDEDGFQKEFDARIAVFIEVLKVLDAEGLFGRSKGRQKVTLLVAMGDQETKLLLNCARQVHPASVYKEFAKAFPTETAGRFTSIGSRKVYETQAVVLSRNGRLLACPGSSTRGSSYVFGFQLPSRKEVLSLPVRGLVSLWALAVSPDAATIYAGWASLCGDGKAGIRCWDVRTKKLKWDVKSTQVCSLDASLDGAFIASGDIEGGICVWNTNNGKLVHKSAATKAFSRDACAFPQTEAFWRHAATKRLFSGIRQREQESAAFQPPAMDSHSHLTGHCSPLQRANRAKLAMFLSGMSIVANLSCDWMWSKAQDSKCQLAPTTMRTFARQAWPFLPMDICSPSNGAGRVRSCCGIGGRLRN